MGKFISKRYTDTINGLTSFDTDLLSQDFYMFNSDAGRGTQVTYYNINKDQSTLDPGSLAHYADIGKDSPLRFNKINGLFIYGMPRQEVNLDMGEYGMEANEISGDSYILPNQINPTDGDFFTIDQIKDKNGEHISFLYKVRDSSMDTLPSSGMKVWKISWVLDRTTDHEILQNVVKEYNFVESTEGTNVKHIVESSKYELAAVIDNTAESLRNYFKDLFYSPKIQTFTYKWYNEYAMYDPYAIEFIIRNKLLQSSGSDYMYIQHQTAPNATFGISYMKSIFRAFEKRDLEDFIHYSYLAQANAIDDPTSIFSTRFETYFALDYDIIQEPNGPFNPRGIIPIMDEEWREKIMCNQYFDNDDKPYRNIIIKYFNHKNLIKEDLRLIDDIDYASIEEIFYELLFLIFTLDFYTEQLLSE